MGQKKVLITGCSGYLGSEMSAFFIDHGWQVFGIDMVEPPDGLRLTEFIHDKVGNVIQGLLDVDVVIHLAGLTKLGFDREEYWRNNVESTKRLRDLYPELPILFASTCAMYNEHGLPDVNHPYPASKREAEQYADIVFRMGSVTGCNRFGHYLRVPDHMIANAYKEKLIRVINPDAQRALSSIGWICEQYRLTSEKVLVPIKKFPRMNTLVQTQTSMKDLGHMVRDVIGDSDIEIRTEYIESDLAFLTGSNIVPDAPTDEDSLRELVQEAVRRYDYFVRGQHDKV